MDPPARPTPAPTAAPWPPPIKPPAAAPTAVPTAAVVAADWFAAFCADLPPICAVAYWRHSPSSPRNWSKVLVLPGRTSTPGPSGIVAQPARTRTAGRRDRFLNLELPV